MVIKEFKGHGNSYTVTDLKEIEDIPSNVMDNAIDIMLVNSLFDENSFEKLQDIIK
jgi:hypothetical protein